MSQLQIHAKGTPDESFLVPASTQDALFSKGYLCRQCPYAAVEGKLFRCKSQCALPDSPEVSKVLIHKKYWTPEIETKFLKLRLQGQV